MKQVGDENRLRDANAHPPGDAPEPRDRAARAAVPVGIGRRPASVWDVVQQGARHAWSNFQSS
jgi:hypothetical protein